MNISLIPNDYDEYIDSEIYNNEDNFDNTEHFTTLGNNAAIIKLYFLGNFIFKLHL